MPGTDDVQQQSLNAQRRCTVVVGTDVRYRSEYQRGQRCTSSPAQNVQQQPVVVEIESHRKCRQTSACMNSHRPDDEEVELKNSCHDDYHQPE